MKYTPIERKAMRRQMSATNLARMLNRIHIELCNAQSRAAHAKNIPRHTFLRVGEARTAVYRALESADPSLYE